MHMQSANCLAFVLLVQCSLRWTFKSWRSSSWTPKQMIRTFASPRPQSWWRRVNPRSRTSRCVRRNMLNDQRHNFGVVAGQTLRCAEQECARIHSRHRLHQWTRYHPWNRLHGTPKGDADDLLRKRTVKRLLALSSAEGRAASIACRLQQHAETVLLPKRRESQFPAQPPQMAVLRHEQSVQEPLNTVQADAEQISFCKVYPDGNYAFRGTAIELLGEYWKVPCVNEGQPFTTPRPHLTVRWYLKGSASGEVAQEMFG